MAAEKIFRIFLALLYFIFALLLLASAVASVIQRMPVAAVIFLALAIIFFYMAVIRLKGKGCKRTEAGQ